MIRTGEETPKNQKSVVERLLLDEQVLVHVNPSGEDVVIPDHLVGNTSVTLRLSRYFRGALDTTEAGVTAELLFGDTYYTCVLPWSCIWGASSVRGEEYVWSEAAPEGVLDFVMSRQKESVRAGMPSRPGASRRPNHLRRVK